MILRGPFSGAMSRPASRALVMIGAVALPLLPGWASGRVPEGPQQVATPAPGKAEAPAAPPQVAAPAVTKPAAKAGGPPHVVVSRPIKREVSDYGQFVGRTESVQSVEIRARVGGTLLKAHFKPGMMVKQGDLLFEIDPRPYEVALEKAEAEFQRAEALKAQAGSVLARDQRTDKKIPGIIPKDDLEKASGDYAATSAGVKIAQASREIALLNLSYARIKAPITGQIGRVLLSPGNLVSADSTTMATLVSVDPLYVYFDIDERTVLRLNRLKREGKAKAGLEAGMPVRIGMSDEGDLPRQSRVEAVDNRFDPNTGTLRLRALLPNPDKSILPGMFARVQVITGPPREALLVPQLSNGAMISPNHIAVVTEKNVLEFKRVHYGADFDGMTEVKGEQPADLVEIGPDGPRRWLQADDWVVFDGNGRTLSPGIQVVPERKPVPASP